LERGGLAVPGGVAEAEKKFAGWVAGFVTHFLHGLGTARTAAAAISGAAFGRDFDGRPDNDHSAIAGRLGRLRKTMAEICFIGGLSPQALNRHRRFRAGEEGWRWGRRLSVSRDTMAGAEFGAEEQFPAP